MRSVTSIVLLISVAATSGAVAQINKPRAPEPTERLPAPSRITATAGPDGPIRVVWSAVDGATKYSLTRAVPPAGRAPLILPNPSDTQYVDANVRPGRTYHYVVAALNEAGAGATKAAPPVTAADPTVTRPSITPTDTSTGPPPGGPPTGPPSDTIPGRPPADSIKGGTPRDTTTPTDTVPGRLPTDTIKGGTPKDTAKGTPGDSTVPRTDPVPCRPPTDTSTVHANRVLCLSPTVRPAVVAPSARIKVGASVNPGTSSTFAGLRLRKPRWFSLDESIATVNTRGKVLGRAAGFTYIIAIGLTPEGAVASLVQRVDVKR